MFCREEEILSGDVDQGLVANYHIQARAPLPGGDASDLSARLKSAVLEAFSGFSKRIVANVRVKDEWNMLSYFEGEDVPEMSIVYTLYLADLGCLEKFRAAQKTFEARVEQDINTDISFVCFGKRGVILDQNKKIAFDVKRQPDMKGLIGSFQ